MLHSGPGDVAPIGPRGAKTPRFAAILGSVSLQFLLRVSALIDVINARLGLIANWMVLTSCVISAGNAMVRYTFDTSSNAWLEIQWYMFGVMFMLGASYTPT